MMGAELAPFACLAEASRGRRFAESESATRSCFQRDRDRIIHSAAFRRLEYKTQVFVNHEGDHYRTRLTHSLEVSQIARSIARSLRLNEDLAEALALAHDLGHTPFGHAGEDALSEMLEPFGGFDHNAQSLAVITRLERRYPGFDGLNLTWETLEGVVKHNGPLTGDAGAGKVPLDIARYVAEHDLEIGTHAGSEAQIAALSDDIAYNNHDLDDGLRAELFGIEDLGGLPLVGDIFAAVTREYPGIQRSRLIHEAVRRLIGAMVTDCLAESARRIDEIAPESAADVRHAGRPICGFSGEMREIDRALKDFLFHNMYRHYKVNRMTTKARRVVRELFAHLLDEPRSLPTEWYAAAGEAGSEATARTVGDYIAGMTDRFALQEHGRLIDVQARTS
jgi:dGTPase